MQFSIILSILCAASAVSGIAVPRSIPGDADNAKNLNRRQACADWSITLGYVYTFDCDETAEPGAEPVVVDDKPKPVGWDNGPVAEPNGWDKDPAGEPTGWSKDPAGQPAGWGTKPVVEPVVGPDGWDKEPAVVVV